MLEVVLDLLAGPVVTGSAIAIGGMLVVASILSQVALWQRKEYRLDRWFSAVRWGELQSKTTPILFVAYVAWGMALIIFMFNGRYHVASLVALVGFIVHHTYYISTRGLARPTPTAKVLTIVAVCIALSILIVGAWYWYIGEAVLLVITLVAITPEVVGDTVVVINLLSAPLKRREIARAISHRQRHKTLTAIGITGSAGKTSAKEFAYHLLAEHVPGLVKSSHHRNAPLPIARDMQEQITSNTTHYLCEMAAYRRGEINELIELVAPQIGIHLGADNQHLSLFGSREDIQEAKWELIAGLPPDAVALIHAADRDAIERTQSFSGDVITFGAHVDADIQARDIRVEPTAVHFSLHVRDSDPVPVTLQQTGDALLTSTLAAVALAHHLGMTTADIVKRLATLPTLPQTMSLVQGINGATVIDDSYSGSEAAALAAIRHLEQFDSSDRIVVLVPLIELGSDGARVHEAIGRALAAANATVFMYGTHHQDAIARGMGSHVDRLVVYAEPRPLATALKTIVNSSSVVLLEGRLPSYIRSLITTTA